MKPDANREAGGKDDGQPKKKRRVLNKEKNRTSQRINCDLTVNIMEAILLLSMATIRPTN